MFVWTRRKREKEKENIEEWISKQVGFNLWKWIRKSQQPNKLSTQYITHIYVSVCVYVYMCAQADKFAMMRVAGRMVWGLGSSTTALGRAKNGDDSLTFFFPLKNCDMRVDPISCHLDWSTRVKWLRELCASTAVSEIAKNNDDLSHIFLVL